jgi:hypothetical protein
MNIGVTAAKATFTVDPRGSTAEIALKVHDRDLSARVRDLWMIPSMWTPSSTPPTGSGVNGPG